MIMKYIITSVLVIFFSCQSLAGVNLSKTRVILNEKDNYRGSLIVNNESDDEYLIYSWVDDGKEKIGDESIIVMPPLRLISGRSSSIIKIMDISRKKFDEEGVYYLNVKVIPKRGNDKNNLHISTNTRIKIFIRSNSLQLSDGFFENRELITAYYKDGNLVLENKSDYSFNYSEINHGKHELGGGIIMPNDSVSYKYVKKESCVKINVINDYGAIREEVIFISNLNK